LSEVIRSVNCCTSNSPNEPHVDAIYRIDPDNCGDLATPPHKYVDLGLPVIEHDIFGAIPRKGDALMVGGGGILGLTDRIASVTREVRIRIIWGGGLNTHGNGRDARWPEALKSFKLVGLRDWNSPFDWVPCASCLSRAFDNVPDPRHEIVVYNHKDFPTGVTQFPALNNRASMETAIAHIASGETVITSSYHGAYWGILLGRAVIVVNPFSNKFFHFRFQPVVLHNGTWSDARPTKFPEALEACRSANLAFYKKVQQLLRPLA
jgi:hypothetical protein